jgi:putative membrane protein
LVRAMARGLRLWRPGGTRPGPGSARDDRALFNGREPRMIRTLTVAALAFGLGANARAEDSSAPLPDEYFAMKAYAEGLAEVAKSQLAIEKASDAEVKAFAQQMVKDHTAVNEKIAKIARTKGIELPQKVDFVHARAAERLAKLSGSDFDKAYMMAQIGAHEDAIHLFGHESHKGKDAELKALAHETLPNLWNHAKHAFTIAGEKEEFAKLHKIHEYAKDVMSGK